MSALKEYLYLILQDFGADLLLFFIKTNWADFIWFFKIILKFVYGADLLDICFSIDHFNVDLKSLFSKNRGLQRPYTMLKLKRNVSRLKCVSVNVLEPIVLKTELAYHKCIKLINTQIYSKEKWNTSTADFGTLLSLPYWLSDFVSFSLVCPPWMSDLLSNNLFQPSKISLSTLEV